MNSKRNVELTLEKAKEWYKKGGELKEVALQAFKENELKDSRSHSWDEFCNKPNHCGYYIDAFSKINKVICSLPCCNKTDKNVYPTEEYAEAALALCQLLQLRQEWVGDWEPDWNYSKNNENRCSIYVIYSYCNQIIYGGTWYNQRVLSFPTEKMVIEFMNDFKDLIEIAKPLL